MAQEAFDSWALVEMMGHQRIAGRVTEAEIGGCKFVRVDVPESDGRQSLTKFLGPSSIYAITPMSEDTARAVAKRITTGPISEWDAERLVKQMSEQKKQLLPAAVVDAEIDADDDEDDEMDEDRPF